MSSNNHIDEDEQFRQVFNGECDVSQECLDTFWYIKNNYPNATNLRINSIEEIITELGWSLIGRYIAKNTHLTQIILEGPGMTDARISTLFESLVRSSSIKLLALGGNRFGRNGVRTMLTFLGNSPQLVDLSIYCNNNINTECFELLVSTLHNTGIIKRLNFTGCNITDISALDANNLPNLINLSLNGNNIGRVGCNTLSNILQNEGSTLKYLHLDSTGIGDEEVKILVTALKHNTSLKELHLLNNNDITERGHVAVLKLLNDVSSPESTYTSNHTLRSCHLTELGNRGTWQITKYISDALVENEVTLLNYNPGRAKVIGSHLNSRLKKLCELQGIEYTPGSIFADVEPVLLPDILALIRSRHGQSELYTALIHTAPDLLSFIDRKALIRGIMDKNTARAAALKAEYEREMAILTAKNNELSHRLALMESGDSQQSSIGKYNGDKGKKRRRDSIIT